VSTQRQTGLFRNLSAAKPGELALQNHINLLVSVFLRGFRAICALLPAKSLNKARTVDFRGFAPGRSWQCAFKINFCSRGPEIRTGSRSNFTDQHLKKHLLQFFGEVKDRLNDRARNSCKACTENRIPYTPQQSVSAALKMITASARAA